MVELTKASGPAGMPLTREMVYPEEAPRTAMYTPEEARANAFFELPIGAGPNDTLLASDDPTVYTYRMQDGSTYYLPAYEIDQTLSEPRTTSEALDRAADYIPSLSQIAAIPQQAYNTADRLVSGQGTYGDVAEAAGSVALGGRALATATGSVPDDALGMFIGERAALTPSQQTGVFRARQYPGDQQDTPTIWEDTLWRRDTAPVSSGGKARWVSEISDEASNIIPTWNDFYKGFKDLKMGEEQYSTLGQVFDHPLLYQNYPALPNLNVRFQVAPENEAYSGHFDPQAQEILVNIPPGGNVDSDALQSLLLHEIQHGVQAIEGWSGRGMSTDWLGGKGIKDSIFEGIVNRDPQIDDFGYWSQRLLNTEYERNRIRAYEDDPLQVYNEVKKTPTGSIVEAAIINDYEQIAGIRPMNEGLQELDDYRSGIEGDAAYALERLQQSTLPGDLQSHLWSVNRFRSPSTYATYLSEAGEKEARNTQNRATMSVAERRDNYPLSTEDTQQLQTWYWQEAARASRKARNAIDTYLQGTP